MYRVIFFFFLLSGFSSLVFEIIWARMLQQVFGSTSFAISTLLTAFMAGLALGSYLGGKLASRLSNQLRLYGLLEGAIGLYALLVPLLLAALPELYRIFFGTFLENFYLFSLLRFLAVFAILLFPTTLMGATLPLVSQWLSHRRSSFHADLGLLYGSNTFGACAGTFLAGFFLLPMLGLHSTNVAFAIVNFALAALVLATERPLSRATTPEHPAPNDDELLTLFHLGTDSAAPSPPRVLRIALILFGLSGLVSMTYQVFWTRAYLIVLGSSTYSFTLVLTAVLIGIALGSAALSPFVRRIQRPLFALGMTQFLVAATATLSFYILDRTPLFLFERARAEIASLVEIYAYQFGLVALVVFLPSLFQGMAFPLIMRAVTSNRATTGRQVGTAYAYSTAGSIIGSFAGGFVLLPWLGLSTGIATIVLLNLFIATSYSILELNLHRTRQATLSLGACAAAAGLLFFFASPIDSSRLTSGVFRIHAARDMMSEASLERAPDLLYFRDGLTATTSVEQHGNTIVLKANGKPEASDGADMATQVMVGLLPFILRSGWDDLPLGQEEAALIGFGSGVTSGASLQWPIRSLDVIEIEAAMVEASRFFEHVNNQPLTDPRHQIIESDGRNYLEYTEKHFDVIISEPSNPWIAGVSALFTREFFGRVRAKLNDGGIYAQWVQLYELSPQNVRRVFATFADVFPHVHAFSSKPKSTDLILIGSNRPLHLSSQSLHRAWEVDSLRTQLRRIGIDHVDELHGLFFMTDQELRIFSDGAEVNTDDNGLLEFSAPRDLIFYEEGQEFFARFYYETPLHGDPRQYLTGWPQQWSHQDTARLGYHAWIAGKPQLAQAILAERGLSAAHRSDDPYKDLFAVLNASQLDWRHATASLDPAVYSEVLDLANTRRWRQALRTFEAIPDAHSNHPAHHFLHATLLERRRRYREAFRAYLQYASLAAETE